MSMLYLRHAGSMQGPFDPAEVRRRLAAGELARWTMSWRAGEKHWQSLGRRWPAWGIWNPVLSTCMVIAVAVLVIAIIGIPGRLFERLPDAWQTKGFVVTSAVCGLLAAVGLSIALVRRTRRDRGRATLPAALCVMLAVLGGMVSLGLCVQMVGVIGAVDRVANAAVSYDPGAHAIRITGMFGHRFHSDVVDALRAHGDTRLIIINSGGGLLDEAFEVGAEIKRAGLPLRVDGKCASACGLMWAGVPQRQMTMFSRIGLHQNRMIGDAPNELTVAAGKASEQASVDALTEAGFTPAMLQRRSQTPPEKMYWLDAVDIMSAGIDARVTDADGKPVDVAAAKWAVAAAAFGHGSVTERLYQAIAVHEPDVRDTYENRLYDAWHKQDRPLFRYEDDLMETAAMRQAFMQVSDQTVSDWIQSRQQDLAQANRQGNTQACEVLTGRAANKAIDPAVRKWVGEHSAARSLVLVNAIPASAPLTAATMDRHKAVQDSDVFVRALLAQVHQEGFPQDHQHWSEMQHCDYANRFLLGLERMPLASGAEIVRYNEAGRYTR